MLYDNAGADAIYKCNLPESVKYTISKIVMQDYHMPICQWCLYVGSVHWKKSSSLKQIVFQSVNFHEFYMGLDE